MRVNCRVSSLHDHSSTYDLIQSLPSFLDFAAGGTHDFDRLSSPPPLETIFYKWHDWPIPSEDEAMELLLSMTQERGTKINDLLPILGRCKSCGRIMVSTFAQNHRCPPESLPSSPALLSKGKKLGLYGPHHTGRPSTPHAKVPPFSPGEWSSSLPTG